MRGSLRRFDPVAAGPLRGAATLWGGGLFRRSYTVERGGVIVARAESRGLLRRSYQVTAGEQRLSFRRPTFFGRTVVIEQGRDRFGEIKKTSLFRRRATVQLDVRLEDTVSLRTLGEDPTAIVATYFNRPDPPKGATAATGTVVDVSYKGIVPDTFKPEAEVVMRGKLSADGFHVVPNGIMAKCPSKYKTEPTAYCN